MVPAANIHVPEHSGQLTRNIRKMSSSEIHNVDALIKLIQEKAELKSGVGPDRALQARKLFRKAMDMPLTKDMFRENLVKVFSISLDETTLDALFRRYDADNDGNIDMGEFAKQILLEDFPKVKKSRLESKLITGILIRFLCLTRTVGAFDSKKKILKGRLHLEAPKSNSLLNDFRFLKAQSSKVCFFYKLH